MKPKDDDFASIEAMTDWYYQDDTELPLTLAESADKQRLYDGDLKIAFECLESACLYLAGHPNQECYRATSRTRDLLRNFLNK